MEIIGHLSSRFRVGGTPGRRFRESFVVPGDQLSSPHQRGSMVAQPRAPRVLIVDDNPLNRAAFEAVLDRDFHVIVAESGPAAIAVCRDQDFAVIVLDIRMPGMDGFETAEALRKLDRTRM